MFKTLKLANGNFMRVDFISPSIFRIRLDNNEASFPDGGMARYGIVDAQCRNFAVKEVQGKERDCFSTGEAGLTVDLRNGKATLLDKAGKKLLCSDKAPKSSMPGGFEISFKLSKDAKLYGMGDESRDRLQRRGRKAKMVVINVSAYAPIPFVMSDCGWAVFMNSAMFHTIDAGDEDKNSLSFHGDKGLLDCFLFAGNSLPDLLDKYTSVSGRPHLLPRWGYGLTFICDERGVRARDVLYEAYEFRRQGIPCDVIGLEPGWMEKSYDFSTDKSWSQERFHIPVWLKDRDYGTFNVALRNMGFKLSLWLCCDYDLSEYEESQIKGEFQGQAEEAAPSLEDDLVKDPHFHSSRFDNITKPGVPWFEHLKKFVDDGASAFKLDGANQICFHPDRKWSNGMEDCEMHNLYPLLYAKQMSLGFKDYTGRRSMIYTASGYAGIQRYAATWAGDTGGGAKTLVSLLNHGLSGHSNTCSDMEVHTDAGIHYGFFQPLSVVLGWHMYSEPWFLGERRAAMFKDYATLRYKLMPYIYSMAHLAAGSGTPILRAMPLAFPNEPDCDKYVHQYMFGESFLVGAFGNTIFLPKGKWIDYWTGRCVEGGREIAAEFPENRGGPLFVKAGAIIPTQEVNGATGKGSPAEICWEVFPHGESSFVLREDDGESDAYLEGKAATTILECNETSNGILLSLHPRCGAYAGMPEKRTHSFKVFHPGRLSVVNAGISWKYDESLNILYIAAIAGGAKTIAIKLQKK